MNILFFLLGLSVGSFSTAIGILLGAYLFKAHPEILQRVKETLPRKRMKILEIAEEEALENLNKSL